MKNNLIKFYIFSVLFMSDYALFAQPGTDDGSGGLEDDDPPPAPINGKLFWLALFGILFVFNYYRIRKNKTS